MKGLLILIAVVLAIMFVTCGDDNESGLPPLTPSQQARLDAMHAESSEGVERESSRVTVHGTLRLDNHQIGIPGNPIERLNFTIGVPPRAGDDCEGGGPFEDVVEGKRIDITGPSGELLGSGTLGPGRMQDVAPQSFRGDCVFEFTITRVPRNMGLYSVEMSGHGRTTFSENDLDPEDLEILL